MPSRTESPRDLDHPCSAPFRRERCGIRSGRNGTGPRRGWVCNSGLKSWRHRLGHLALVALTIAARAGSDWPQFRGPTGDGQATATNLPLVWGPTQNVVWKVAVPGKGRSSPVVLGAGAWKNGIVLEATARFRNIFVHPGRISPSATVLAQTRAKSRLETAMEPVDCPFTASFLLAARRPRHPGCRCLLAARSPAQRRIAGVKKARASS